jgi:CcmD family protein
MRKIIAAISIFILLSLLGFFPMASAQNEAESTIEMADNMRSNGKIYVVVLVVGIVFSGLVIYAINTDRKVTKLEKEIKSLKSTQDS